MKKSTLRHFGIDRLGFFRDGHFMQLAKDIAEDILDNQMVVVAGKWGMGKSTLFNEVKRILSADPETAPKFVRVASEDKEKIRIGNIMKATLMDLTTEKLAHDLEARSRQTIKVIGQTVKMNPATMKVMGQRVVIFIENAHRLHVNTIRALKDFREHDYNGCSPLFSVVLVGQEDLLTKVNTYGEVRCRTSSYELSPAEGWMTYEKRVRYIDAVYGSAVTPNARKRIASVFVSPLAIYAFLDEQMEALKKAGITQVDEDVIDGLSMKERYRALQDVAKVGYREIAAESGVALGSVANAMNGFGGDAVVDKVKNALKNLEVQGRNIAVNQ